MPIQAPDPRAPCACGSTRAFGVCCADQYAHDLAAWERMRDSERRLVPQVIEYALVTWGWELFAMALRFFSIGNASPRSFVTVLSTFDRWCTLTWAPRIEDPDLEDLVPATWPSAPLALTWVASTGQAVTDADRAFIVAAARSPFSWFQIEHVRPRWSLTVRDLLTGRRFVVVDPEIASRALVDDIIFSAVVTMDGVATFVGPAPLSLTPDARLAAAELLEGCVGRPSMTRAELVEWDCGTDLASDYREACERGPAYTLETGAHDREPFHLRWNVSSPFYEVFERLRPLAACYEDEEAISIENEPQDPPRLTLTWYQRGVSEDPDDWEMLAYVYLEEGRLSADVAARAHANRLLEEVQARLGSAATLIEMRPSAPTHLHSRESFLPLRLVMP